MHRNNLTQYEEIDPKLLKYLSYRGPHFDKALLDFAVSKMTVRKDGKETKLEPIIKQDVDFILKENRIKLENNELLDYVYVANMCKADFIGSSIPDDTHMALYIKDVIDDIDAPDGLVFNRWYADMCYKGIPIDWDEILWSDND